MRRRAIVVPADAWLDRLIHRSPAFQAKVDEALAAINVAQALVELRELRGLSQVQLADRLGITQPAIAQMESALPRNVELRTLVRVATALGARVDVTIRPHAPLARKARPQKRLSSRKTPALRSQA